MSNDLAALFSARQDVDRWKAENENASARLQLARSEAARAQLLSQHEPLHSLGLDRNVIRVLLAFTNHGDEGRMKRELDKLRSTT